MVQAWMFQEKALENLQEKFDPKMKICEVVNGNKMMEQNRRTKQIYVTFSSVALQVSEHNSNESVRRDVGSS